MGQNGEPNQPEEELKKEVINEVEESASHDSEIEKRERERLKNEIAAEVKNRLTTQEILHDLNLKKSSRPSITQNPAFLLILGFILTTGLGTWLTSWWQSTEKARQDSASTKQRMIEQKQAIADDVNRAVAETKTAGEDLLTLFLFDEYPKLRDKTMSENMDFFMRKSREWRVNSKILQQKVINRFRNKDASKKLNEIISIRASVGEDIRNLRLEVLDSKDWKIISNMDFRKRVRETLQKSEQMSQETVDLMRMMSDEIKEDERDEESSSIGNMNKYQ